MLPVEAFVDVVSFLGYYDLGGLSLASKRLSDIANRCADATRLFDFSDFAFFVDDDGIDVCRLDAHGDDGPWVCQLEFSREDDVTEFISDAFRNCTVGRFFPGTRRERYGNAIILIAKTVVVADTLDLLVELNENEQRLYEFVDSFRRVKVCALEHALEIYGVRSC